MAVEQAKAKQLGRANRSTPLDTAVIGLSSIVRADASSFYATTDNLEHAKHHFDAVAPDYAVLPQDHCWMSGVMALADAAIMMPSPDGPRRCTGS